MSNIVQSPAIAKEGEAAKSRHSSRIIHSLRLLDDAITPSKRSHIPSVASDSPNFGSTPTINSLSRYGNFLSSKHTQNTSKFSVTLNQTDLDATEYLLQPKTPTQYSLGLHPTIETDGTAVSRGLFNDFKDCILRNSSSSEIFNLLESYEEVCSDYLMLLSKMLSQVTPEEGNSDVEDLKQLLVQEKHTWRIVNALYRDRLTEKEEMNVDCVVRYHSEKSVVEEYFQQDSDIRQAQIVIDWLERNAFDDLTDVADKLQHYTGRSSWENSLYHLKKNLERGSSVSQNFIAEMDPDAPIRTRRQLHDLDREDEMRLLKCIFSYIRAGRINEAEDLCTAHGQPWRVAVLEGWRLFHDQNMVHASEDGGFHPLEGNARRSLWKLAAWTCSNNPAYDIKERAIYGALCGNLKAMMDVSNSWGDALWAYYKTMVDIATERLIQRSPNIRQPWQQMHATSLPEEYFMQKCDLNDLEEVFEKITWSTSTEISEEAKRPHCFIQRCIILNDMKSLQEKLISWIEGGAIHNHLLRFFSHLILFLQSAGAPLDPDKCTRVLEAYVKQLIVDEKTGHLVAVYTASLPPEEQLSCYASFLEAITGSNLRRKYVDLAEEAGLDVAAITKNVVERIRASGQPDTAPLNIETTSDDSVLEPPLTSDDHRKIDAIEWLVFDPSQRVEAVKQSNAVMRTFLAARKHTAARQVLQKIPRDSIDIIHREWRLRADKRVPLPAEIENAEREYLSLQAYLDAQTAFSDWFKHFHCKPPPYQPVSQSASFINASMSDMVAEEQRQKIYEDDMRRWSETLDRLCEDCRDKVYNVLLFPDGGWLVDSREVDSSDDDESRCRRRQMEMLRRLYIPSLCHLLLNVLIKTGDRSEQCAKLADVLADADMKLYQLFTEREGQKILSRIQDAMIDIL